MNAISNLILQNKNATLNIFCLSTKKHIFIKEKLQQNYIEQTNIKNAKINTNYNVFKFIGNINKKYPYQIARFYCKNASNKLQAILKKQKFDFVILESIFVAPYLKTIKTYSAAKIILRSHNIETELLKKRILQGNFLQKIAFSLMLRKMKNYETKIGCEVDGILAIGKREASFFRKFCKNKAIEILPNAVEVKENAFELKNKKIKLFHIGAMDWQPNKDGIDYFVNNVWNNKLAEDFELHLAGKGLNKDKYKNINGVFNYGFVNSAFDFMNDCDIMVVPLKTASGVRIKILEAMSIGKPVISTKIGLLGIEAKNNLEVLTALTINDISLTLKNIAEKNVDLKSISANAKNFIQTNYSIQSIKNQLFTFIHKL